MNELIVIKHQFLHTRPLFVELKLVLIFRTWKMPENCFSFLNFFSFRQSRTQTTVHFVVFTFFLPGWRICLQNQNPNQHESTFAFLNASSGSESSWRAAPHKWKQDARSEWTLCLQWRASGHNLFWQHQVIIPKYPIFTGHFLSLHHFWPPYTVVVLDAHRCHSSILVRSNWCKW